MNKKNKLGAVLGQVGGFKIRQVLDDKGKQTGIGVYRGKKIEKEFNARDIDDAKKFAKQL